MVDLPYVTSSDVDGRLTWSVVVDALKKGHNAPRAHIKDTVIDRGENAFLSRSAWVEGAGIGVKAFTVFAGNTRERRSTVQGAMTLFDDISGKPVAIIDSDLVTKWKTAGDSVLGASFLARADSESLLVLGAGEAASHLVDAYLAIFTRLKQVEIWNRTPAKATALASRARARTMNSCDADIRAITDLNAALGRADIISTATMSTSPLIMGAGVTPGTHVDLVGAYKADMREADDALMARAELFVDSRDTTLKHIGELIMPLASGVITQSDIRGDLYDLCAGAVGRSSEEAVTVFKNGGGAHLDVMTARAILDAIS
ncbi:MAG: ornithine cyclodeaminase [Pseudomonadota bacterium]